MCRRSRAGLWAASKISAASKSGRQREHHFAYHRREILPREPAPQDACAGLPRDGFHDYRLRRQVCAAVLAPVYGRRARYPRLRNLGGNVNTISPTIDAKYFHVNPLHKTHVLAFHAMGSMITGYGGKYVPPFSRRFMGGEQDIRGFEIWGITPIAYIPSSASVPVLNSDGTPRTQKIVSNGAIVSTPVRSEEHTSELQPHSFISYAV